MIKYLLLNQLIQENEMKTFFDKMIITYAEYEYFKTLTGSEQIKFFFDSYDAQRIKTTGLDLSEFFGDLQMNLEQYKMADDKNETSVIENQSNLSDANLDADYVDVTIDDTTIMIESNSLRATKHVTYKFIESGYMLSRDIATEKMFKRDKTTRYIRVFRIISYSTGMCFN